MYEREREPRGRRFYVEDMIGFCESVRDNTARLDQTASNASPIRYDATLRNLELIDEAATRIPEGVRDAYSEIPWRTIIGVRNRLIHEYLRIDNDVVWDTVRNDVPALLASLRELLETTGSE